jgi:AcrR family transcriptional regulator
MCARTSEEKKEMIIMNFVSLIQEHGINRITLSDVAEKSGLTKSALYYYFDSKEALLIEGFDHFNKKLNEKFAPLVEKAKTPKDILFLYSDFHLKVFFGGYEEFRTFMEISTEVFYEIQKYIFNSPDIAKKILSHRDTELNWLNSIMARYLEQDPEDDRTKKITLMYAGFLHSFVSLTSQVTKQSKALESFSIISEFPWRLDNIENKDIFSFLIGGIDRLKEKLFG